MNQEPLWPIENRKVEWSNASLNAVYSLFFLTFSGYLLVQFIYDPTRYGSLVFGLICAYGVYEIAAHSFIRISYLNGTLEFKKPYKKYSLFRKKGKSYQLTIQSHEWTEMHWKTYKDSTVLYFRHYRTAAYYAHVQGFRSFPDDLETLSPNHLITDMEDVPVIVRDKLRSEMPERVF